MHHSGDRWKGINCERVREGRNLISDATVAWVKFKDCQEALKGGTSKGGRKSCNK